MRELFDTVMELQLKHSSQNTPEMIERGKIIRDTIPAEMRSWPATKSQSILPFRGRLSVQGKDGTGLKTFVPWVRIHSPEMSPSPQKGWYVVYLFRTDGEGVALCISHGSTRFDGRDFIPRSAKEAAELMIWSRGLIGPQAAAIGMTVGVDLGSHERLSKAYESTTAFSKTYDRASVPDDATLAADAARAVGLLGELYRAQELGTAPYSEPPEIIEVIAAVEGVSRPSSAKKAGSGQGFGLNAVERAAVEKRAMDEALLWLTANGFTNVRDVHASHSCDFLADRNAVEHHVEVKGTTSVLGKIILTANEVALHKATYPANVLIVVYGVKLHETRTLAYGGTTKAFDGWDIDDCTLSPLSYICELSC
jgi:hypothetical protein